MTGSNRVLNRTILALLGLVGIALAVVIAALAVDPALLAGVDARLAGAVDAGRQAIGSIAFEPLMLWSIAAVSAFGIVIALGWMLTRGRGRTSTPVVVDGVELDSRVVQQVLQHELRAALDVVGVHATSYRARRRPVVRVRIDVRRGADLVRLMAAVDTAVAALDRTLGTDLPILVHIATGFRTALSREHRAA